MRQEHVQGQLDLGIAAAKDGYWEEARELLEAVAEADPTCFDAWLWLGAIAEEPADSVERLQRAIALRPGSIRAQRGLAWAEARFAGALPAAAITPPPELPAPLTEAEPRVPSPIDPVEIEQPRAAAPEPPTDSAGVIVPEARTAGVQSVEATLEEPTIHETGSIDWDGIMARLRALDHETASDTPEETADAVEADHGVDLGVDDGKKLLDSGEYERAIALFQQAAADEPDDLEAREQLGVALYRAGRLEEALRTFEEIIAAAPEQADALANVGFLLAELGRTEEAVEALRAAVSADGELVEAQARLGEILRARGDVRDAIAVWRQALDLRPGLTDVRIALANLYVETGQPENATWELRLAIDARPADVDLYLALARALAAIGRWDEVITELETALQLSPNQAELHVELGRALDVHGQTEAAIARLERALVLDPDCRLAAERLEAVRARVPAPPPKPPARRGLFGLFR